MYDDVTYVYDDVTYVYDDVTYVNVLATRGDLRHKHVHFRIGLFDGFWVSFMYNRPKLTFSVWGLSPQTENSAKSYDFRSPPVAMCLYY